MDFLKPEPKKFILPAIMLVFFVYVMNEFYLFGIMQNDYLCDTKEYAKAIEMMKDSSFCQYAGTAVYGNVAIEEKTKQKFETAIEKAANADEYWNEKEFVLGLLTLDPFLPIPCEYIESPFCEHYMTETSYECKITENSIEYKPASILAIVTNSIILFLEGYLLSAGIMLLFSVIKKPDKKTIEQPKKKTKRRKFKSSGG